jgi:predicted ATP-dependent serine protease
MENKQEDFTVECNVCKQQLDNWVGSTPCCGSIAYLIDEKTKKVSDKLLLHSALGVVEIEFKR